MQDILDVVQFYNLDCYVIEHLNNIKEDIESYENNVVE